MPPKAIKRDEPREFRATAVGVACAITAEAGEGGDKKLGTFTGNAYTGAPMRPQGWWGPIVIDLAGVQVPNQHRPVLRQHDHEKIVGHTTEVKVEKDGIKVAGVFSGQDSPHAKEITTLAKNGFQWQLSIGATPIRTEYLEAGEETEVNGRTVHGPMTISRETELGEVSFVPLGADGATSADVSASKGRGVMGAKAALKAMKAAGNVRAGKYSHDDIEKMSEEDAKDALKKCMAEEKEDTEAEGDEDAEAEGDDVDADDDEEEKPKSSKSAKGGRGIQAAGGKAKAIAAARKAAADEERRVGGIRACLRKFPGAEQVKLKNGTTVDLVPHAIEAGWSVEKTERTAELHVLRAGRPGPGVGVPGGLAYSTTSPEVTEAVLEAAVLHAARHQFALEDDNFYSDPTPDGKGTVRRVPLHLQKEVQANLAQRYTDKVQQYAHTMFKGRITPHQIIKAGFEAWGHKRELDLSGEHGVRSMLKAWDHYDGGGIRADGSSTLSISNILSNVQNKFALQGYLFTEQAWREFCAIRNVKDFKPTVSLNLLGDVMYKQVGSTGELANANITDQAFANQAKNFGRILTIPWTHIVNDDLGMLTGAPQKIGQGAGLALNDLIWSLWASLATGSPVGSIPAGYNLNGDDGSAFWRTSSSVTAAAMKAGTAYKPNKLSGAGSAFGDAGLKAAWAAFWNQIDPNGNPLGFDGMTPVLLHGPTLWRDVTAQGQAPAIVYGGASAANAPSANPWQGKYKPVMSRYVENANYVNTTTGWWLMFNPIALAVIEVCFLNGVDTPAVLQAGPDYQFDRLGISIRGTMPFGANQQNFRGGVYSVGS